ncbi:MAG: flagellar motor protein MotB [Alphaproteobacteria bacterium]
MNKKKNKGQSSSVNPQAKQGGHEEQFPYASPLHPKPKMLGFHREIEDENPPVSTLWLVTFTDVMALMLTFFVLLYSMAAPDQRKWSDMTASINSNFSKFRSPEFLAGSVDSINIERIDRRRALDLRYLATLIRQALERDGRDDGILLFVQNNALVISVPHNLFFEAGSDEVQPAGQRILFELGGALERIRNAIEIVGHADPRPIERSEIFKSNWDLSLSRASSVAGVLANVGYTRPIKVRGMASARYDDLPEDMPEDEKLDLSRRVDIVVLQDDGARRSIFGMEL